MCIFCMKKQPSFEQLYLANIRYVTMEFVFNQFFHETLKKKTTTTTKIRSQIVSYMV